MPQAYYTTVSILSIHFNTPSPAAREIICKHVAHLEVDRPLYPDHNAMKALVKSGEILEEVEKVVGSLG